MTYTVVLIESLWYFQEQRFLSFMFFFVEQIIHTTCHPEYFKNFVHYGVIHFQHISMKQSSFVSFLTLFFLLTMPSLNSCCLEKFSRLFVLIHDGILGFMYQVGLFTILLRLQVWENSSNEGSIIWMF